MKPGLANVDKIYDFELLRRFKFLFSEKIK